MADVSGFPYFEVQFTKKGNLFEPAEKQAVMAAVGGLDELFVVAHGWNNDIAEARALYRALFANVRRALDNGRAPGLAGRRIGVLGVLWPSKRFADEDLIPGGGASLGGAIDDDTLAEQIENRLARQLEEQVRGVVVGVLGLGQHRAQQIDELLARCRVGLEPRHERLGLLEHGLVGRIEGPLEPLDVLAQRLVVDRAAETDRAARD